MINVSEPRIFNCLCDDGSTTQLRIRRAAQAELDGADMEQSRIFNQCLLNGLPPRTRLLRKLREQSLWTTQDDTNIDTLREKVRRADTAILDLDAKIEKNQDPAALPGLQAQKDAAIKDRGVVFRELNQLRVEIDGMLGHTSDAKADDAHRNYLMACVIERVEVTKPSASDQVNVLGRVWDSVEALQRETDMNMLQRAVYEYMMFQAGMPSEWEKDLAAQAPAPATTDTPAPATDAPVEGEKTEAAQVAVPSGTP